MSFTQCITVSIQSYISHSKTDETLTLIKTFPRLFNSTKLTRTPCSSNSCFHDWWGWPVNHASTVRLSSQLNEICPCKFSPTAKYVRAHYSINCLYLTIHAGNHIQKTTRSFGTCVEANEYKSTRRGNTSLPRQIWSGSGVQGIIQICITSKTKWGFLVQKKIILQNFYKHPISVFTARPHCSQCRALY